LPEHREQSDRDGDPQRLDEEPQDDSQAELSRVGSGVQEEPGRIEERRFQDEVHHRTAAHLDEEVGTHDATRAIHSFHAMSPFREKDDGTHSADRRVAAPRPSPPTLIDAASHGHPREEAIERKTSMGTTFSKLKAGPRTPRVSPGYTAPTIEGGLAVRAFAVRWSA
jgi:hypothetical protein